MSTYDFKYAKLPDNPTKEDIQREITRLKILSGKHRDKDQGLKVINNSVYGVLGYVKFILYERDIAECVTVQSRDIIQYTISKFNHLFSEKWHLLSDLHRDMGITSSVKKYDGEVINYADTDSVFLVLDDVYKDAIRCGYSGTFNEFASYLDRNLFRGYIDEIMDEYADMYGAHRTRRDGSQSMNLELEEICYNIIWAAKKRYIKHISKAGSVEFDKLEKIKPKGLEINKSSTPKWVRDKLKETVEFILSTDNLTSTIISEWVDANVKGPFMHTHIENICVTERANKYGRFIVNDTTSFEVAPNTKPHVSGAGYHNYLLYNSSYSNKYNFISTGDKVQWYYTSKDVVNKYFSFINGQFPIEFAPECDRDMQFEKTYLSPLNNIIKPMGFKELSYDMIVTEPLF